ncbi:hypothetical protein IDF66_03860 [Gordonia hankookensis]|uniref:Uncharacterized protein n=2 Tax=Gordonia hankookensis TaxID=589403 RepID=A0ABR7WA60_9ACTN|nr:hypothetical protein [Gordonia hankookensis]MBD1318707.1 hypothetical protein [Gordonia hankookensis]
MSHMTVQEMINASPLGPILDKSVADVLAGHGLPALPVMPPPSAPLPGLPSLPPINLDILIKPLTDLLGGFGTGNLGAGDFDPSAIFQSLSKVLETTMSMSSGAVKALDKLWTGTASTAAVGKSAIATGDTANVTTQGTGMSFDIQAAAGIVGAGLAAVQAIIAATIGKISATIPLIMTPFGQGAAVGFATEGLAEATAQVALTRAQLLGPTAKMTTNGAPVPITNAPTPASSAQSPFAVASAVLDGASPAVSSASELPSMIASPVSSMLSSAKVDPLTSAKGEPAAGKGGGPGGGGAGGGGKGHAGGGGGKGHAGGGGGIGAVGAAAAPLAPRPFSSPALGMTEPAGYSPQQATRGTVTSTNAMPASMAPMGAAGTARGAGASNEQHQVPDYLVTEDNGQQVVGEVPDVVPAVLGYEHEPESPPSPDIELRLGPPPGGPTTGA